MTESKFGLDFQGFKTWLGCGSVTLDSGWSNDILWLLATNHNCNILLVFFTVPSTLSLHILWILLQASLSFFPPTWNYEDPALFANYHCEPYPSRDSKSILHQPHPGLPGWGAVPARR